MEDSLAGSHEVGDDDDCMAQGDVSHDDEDQEDDLEEGESRTETLDPGHQQDLAPPRERPESS